MTELSIPSGFCGCGCGEKTRIANRTDPSTNRFKGKPMRYVHGHNQRKSGAAFEEEDRGFVTPCWIWLRAKERIGDAYGHTHYKKAHVFYYEQKHGPVPEGYELHHLCGVRACVNPDHLQPITPTQHRRLNPRVILSMKEAREIRAASAAGVRGNVLAERYNTGTSNITSILQGKTWKEHIA